VPTGILVKILFFSRFHYSFVDWSYYLILNPASAHSLNYRIKLTHFNQINLDAFPCNLLILFLLTFDLHFLLNHQNFHSINRTNL